ncbi:MAG: glycosyltransferase family 2 protein [Butyricicoccus sp.]
MENPKVSILIPVYNVEKYLRVCLDSVVNQTYDNLEIVLADDGSTDTSGAICDEYAEKDRRITVIHKQNEGLLWTRRVLFRQATGEYYLCVDSDDWIEVHTVETLIRYIQYADADLVLFGFDRVSDDGHQITAMKEFAEDKTIFAGESMQELRQKFAMTGELNSIWSKLISKRLISQSDDSNPIYRQIAMGEDKVQLLPVFMRAQRAVYCASCLYHYRYSDVGMCQNFKAEYLKDMLLLAEEIERFQRSYALMGTDCVPFYQGTWWRVVKNCYTLIHCGKYSREEMTDWLSFVNRHPMVARFRKQQKQPPWNVCDRIVLFLMEREQYQALICFLKWEQRASILLKRQTRDGKRRTSL